MNSQRQYLSGRGYVDLSTIAMKEMKLQDEQGRGLLDELDDEQKLKLQAQYGNRCQRCGQVSLKRVAHHPNNWQKE